jgi:crotonobetainyl-CoA:carnitine CoA-transferase CaiB-like acyl-CoA transferase
MAETSRSGPLSGIKIIELAGIGPAPYTCMMLADAGAQVLRLERAAPGAVERAAAKARGRTGTCSTGRPSVGIDLKNPDAVELVLGLVEQADGLIEGFRPGVAERMGVGPEDCWGATGGGLRAHDGMGSGRSHGAAGRPRHRLHRHRRRAVVARPGRLGPRATR